MAEGDSRTAAGRGARADRAFGRGFLTDIWYFAALGSALKRGRLQRFEILGEPVLLGRTGAGEVYALRDICPHRAAPLSAGRLALDGQGQPAVQCPYHGWLFRTRDGACVDIPSRVEGQALDMERIRVRSFPVRERQGLIWIYMAADPRAGPEPAEPPPSFDGVVGGAPKLVERMEFDTHLDHAVVGLMDPTHGARQVLALTCLTRISERRTRITQIIWADHWAFRLLTPLLRLGARRFLHQDGEMVNLQNQGLAYDPALIWIDDADTQAKWYQALKREWQSARREGRPFRNPVTARRLRWRS